jgi:hypothetical protein
MDIPEDMVIQYMTGTFLMRGIECGCELEFEEIVDNENNICDKCLGDGDE